MRVGLLWSDPRRHRWNSAAVAIVRGVDAPVVRYAGADQTHSCNCGNSSPRAVGQLGRRSETRPFSS